MNILWLTSSYPRFQSDTASIFLKYLAEELAKSDKQIRIIAPDDSNSKFDQKLISLKTFRYFFPRKLQHLAYGSGILPNLKQSPWLIIQIPFFLIAMAFKLIRECVKEKPDLIHAHWIFPVGTVAVLIGKIMKIPVVLTAHGGDAFALNDSYQQRIKRWTLTNASVWTSNTITTASAFESDQLKHCAPARIIPMGVDFDHFNAGVTDRLKHEKSGKRVILFVGRLVEKKGVIYLIEAYEKLITSGHDDISLWIIGDGELKASLMQKAEKISGTTDIRFWGKINHHDLVDFYAAADYFVAPSIIDQNGDTEGQGVVFLEAMAAGLPVVASKAGGIGQVIKHNEHALLCEPASVGSLTEQLELLLADKALEKRISNNGQLLSQQYDWKNIANQFDSLYKEIVNINDK